MDKLNRPTKEAQRHLAERDWYKHQKRLKYLKELWTIPRHRVLFQFDSLKAEKRYRNDHSGFPDDTAKRHAEWLIHRLQNEVQKYRKDQKTYDRRTFIPKHKALCEKEIIKSTNRVHKNVYARIVWVNHSHPGNVAITSKNTLTFRVPVSWYLRVKKLHEITTDQEGLIFNEAAFIGKSSDGHPMYRVDYVRFEFKPRKEEFNVLSSGEGFLTYCEMTEKYAIGNSFQKARNSLRRILAGEVAKELRNW